MSAGWSLIRPMDYAGAHEIIARLSPDLQDRIELYDGDKPIFEQFKIEADVERLLQRKVPLPSGGSLIIDQTEALVSIDVNSGKFTGSVGLSDTILKTNLEATEEIARQLRLRDLGGMIVLDFIDMDSARDKKAVMDAFVKASERRPLAHQNLVYLGARPDRDDPQAHRRDGRHGHDRNLPVLPRPGPCGLGRDCLSRSRARTAKACRDHAA